MRAAIARVSMLQTIIRSADDPTAVQKEPYHAPRIWSCCYLGERDADLFFAPPCQLSASLAARRLSRSGLAIGPSACRGAVRLPADVTVEAVLATRCNNRPAGTTIRHFPSGMSCGGTIALTREGLGYQVRVNWLTGGVEVVPVN